MIYEGAVIRRLVTPNHPGDPMLNDPTADCQYRVEYVRDDAAAPAPGSWTRELADAHRYPNHLEADHRAKGIGGHCFARVVTRDNEECRMTNGETDFKTQGGEAVSQLAHNQKIAGSTPAPANHFPGKEHGEEHGSDGELPAESSSSGRALKQLPGVHSTHRDKRSRAAGKNLSARKAPKEPRAPGRLAKLRASAARVSDRTWWRQGQYA